MKKIIYIIYGLTLWISTIYICSAQQNLNINPLKPQYRQNQEKLTEIINIEKNDFELWNPPIDRWFTNEKKYTQKWIMKNFYEKVFGNNDHRQWKYENDLPNLRWKSENPDNIKIKKHNSESQTDDDNIIPPPPKWFVFRFMWPKKNNIKKTIEKLENIIPKLESKWIDTKIIKADIEKMEINHETTESLMLLWLATSDKKIKKNIWDKMFVLHNTDMQKLKRIKEYISSKLWIKIQTWSNIWSWNN